MQREYKISLSQEFYSDVVYLSQYDEDYPIIFTVFDKYAKANSINGCTAELTGTRTDGMGFTYTASAVGHTVSFVIDAMLTGLAGAHTAEIIFYKDTTKRMGTANIRIVVEPAARPDGTIDGDVERAQEIAEQVQEIVDNAAATVKGEAEAWAVGQRDGVDVPSTDPAYENNAKFYAEQAAQIAEDISEVTDQVATNTSDISDLKEVSSNKETNIFGLTVVDYIDGYYVDTGAANIDETPIASSGWSYAKFDCPPNYRVSIIGYGSSGGRLYCFFDANGNVLEKASGTANTGGDGVMKTYVSPANTAYCIVNSSNRYANKYIVVSPLMDDVIHHKPSTLLTDTTATLESISEGFYRVSSGVASQLSWAPTVSTFNLLICSRSIYPAVTTERFAFAIDTYSRTFINVSGSAGYTGWHQILYVDSYPTTGTLSEYADAIVNSSGVLVSSAIAISTKDFVKDTVVGFQVTDSDIKVAVNRYALTGEHVGKQYWYKSSNTLQDGKYHYKFDHATYKYRIYIFADDNETTIHDKPKLVNGVRLYESIDVIDHYTYHDADYDTFKKQYNFDNISTRLRLIQEANYQLSFANATDWMKLYSYYGDTQIVHPKVLYFPNMLFGHKYWMAYTPYPDANAYYENPCIAYSDDGYRFTNINGNPIDEPTGDRQTSYYSDTHLVYNSTTQKLECWYRLADETNMTESLYRMVSTDGINWTYKQLLKTINSGNSISKFLSPAVIYEDSKYKIWTVNYNENKIEYWESATGETWTKIRDIVLTYSAFDETHRIWHIDIEKIDGVYVMVAMTRQSGTRHWPLYLSTSEDNITWDTPWVVIKYADTDKWDSRIYRSCIVKADGVFRIYYSAYDTSNRYHMAISESSDLHHFCGRDVVY